MYSVNFNVDIANVRPLAESGLEYFESEPERIALSSLSYFCHALHEVPGAEFYIAGFGDPQWAGEVRVELCIFLEQMPDVMPWLMRRAGPPEIILSYFEQGLERDFVHSIESACVSIRCVPHYTDWIPNPEVETVSVDECVRQYRTVIERFIECASVIDPIAFQDSTFRKWMRDVY